MLANERVMKGVQQPLTDEQVRLLDYSRGVYISPKVDGVRACVQNGKLLFSSLKPVPNRQLQREFGRPELNGMEFELTVGSPLDPQCFRRTSSVVRSLNANASMAHANVFDVLKPHVAFIGRVGMAATLVETAISLGLSAALLPLVTVFTAEALFAKEFDWLDAGYEGLVIHARWWQDFYKRGRVTPKEAYVCKRVPWHRGEAIVIGTFPRMTNNNPLFVNERGLQERSKCSELLVDSGRIGGFIVRDLKTGLEFRVASGLSEEDSKQSASYWLGSPISYKCRLDGGYDKPRQAVFMGRRIPEDNTEY